MIQIRSCEGDKEVVVSGVANSGGDDGVSGTYQGPPTRSVPCGRSAPDALIAIGDLNADDDAMSCIQATKDCAAASIDPKHPLTPVVVVVKRSWGWDYAGTPCVNNGPPAVTAALVREQVSRLVPPAAIGLAPSKATLVNIQTIMWVDAPPDRDLAPLTLLGQQVAVHLHLDHVTWNFGDGHSAVSNGPGKPYDADSEPCRAAECPGYFGHTYRDTGDVRVSATASWQASFTVNGGPAVTIPGTVNGPTASSELTVKQARAVLVPNPGGG